MERKKEKTRNNFTALFGSKSSKSSLKGMKKREKIDGLLFMAPFLISTLLFFIGPLLVSFMLSFKEYSLLDSNSMFQAKWVGLRNYTAILHNYTFKKALWNTTKYAVFVTIIQLIISLLLALVVDGKIKGKAFFRTAYYIPTITSTVAVSVMFMFVFKVDGLMNKFLSIFGAGPYKFFTDPKLALPTVMSMAIWSSIGLYMIVFLAGLQDIPGQLYEAAEIDGANKKQCFLNITIPLLKPTIFFNLVISLIGTFQVFDQAYIVSGGNGGPLDSTMTVMLAIYNTSFKDLKMGEACAMAFVLFAIIMILTLIQKKFFGEETSM